MHKSNNTFFSIYEKGYFVKWKICKKCGFLLEKTEQKWNYEIFVRMSDFVDKK